ncbi:MAG TPA: hypothetical protein VKY82_06535 [Flavobacterium sp.]|nr:hypothetical protein [Flavobacterium sp.]
MISTLINMFKALFGKKTNLNSNVKSSSDGTLYVEKSDFYSDKKVQKAIEELKNNKTLLAK